MKKQIKQRGMKVILKFYNNKHEVVHTYLAGTSKRFLAKIRSCTNPTMYIKVSYGKQKDNFGVMQEFYNEGYYTDKKEAEMAFKAFIE